MAKHFKQGRFVPTNSHKYAGDISCIIYRSSWEQKFFNWCDLNPAVLEWSSEETIIPYRCPTDNRVHRYFVDAKIKVQNRHGDVTTYLVEIKPAHQTVPPNPGQKKTKRYIAEVMTWGKNNAKWEAAKEYCKDRGYQFVILTEKHLNIKY